MLRGFLLTRCVFASFALSSIPVAPEISPATGLRNQFFDWKEGQKIRYQVTGPEEGEPVVLVHGLFVNSDHWRKSLKQLGENGYRAYAIDLWGCGYSDKPPANSEVAQRINGENNRFDKDRPDVLLDIELGTAGGAERRKRDVELRHPLGSPYNFFTWSELLNDFNKMIVLKKGSAHETATLVCNSIGTISSLQAALDSAELYKGVFVVCPNFRELHSAEVPLSSISMPIVRVIQKLLRENGQSLFDTLAKPNIVKEILKEPYAVSEAIDDTLVEVLLDPLLTPGASNVVFDTLSYSAGPLPEQQLGEFSKPVWICYGTADPWTPGPRVEALSRYPAVERVDALEGIGHCPHDEAPEMVHPLLFQFLERLSQ